MTHPARSRYRLPRRALLGLVVMALALALYLVALQVTGNFHTVIAGELYRSAQPDPAALAHWQGRYGIRSIVNLRGANPGTDWYDAEIATSEALGIAHYDFRMSAGEDLDGERAAQLAALLRDAPKPVLIHCRSGADRTGLASALFLAAVAGSSEEAAEGQISLYYGHVSLPVSAAWPMDRSWEALEPWLGFPNS